MHTLPSSHVMLSQASAKTEKKKIQNLNQYNQKKCDHLTSTNEFLVVSGNKQQSVNGKLYQNENMYYSTQVKTKLFNK